MPLRTYEQPTEPAQLSLGFLEMCYRTKGATGARSTVIGGNNGRVWVYRAAAGEDDKVYLLDVICTPMEYRAIHAGLTSGLDARFKFYDCGVANARSLECESQFGYRTFTHRITVPGHRQNGRIHYLAVSQHPSFLPVVCEQALAYKLGGIEFSTPFITPHLHGGDVPDWMPYIAGRLVDEKALVYLESHNCIAGFLYPRENVLQQIVTEGVKSGALPWPKYDPSEIAQAAADLKAGLAQSESAPSTLVVDEQPAEVLPTEMEGDLPEAEEEI